MALFSHDSGYKKKSGAPKNVSLSSPSTENASTAVNLYNSIFTVVVVVPQLRQLTEATISFNPAFVLPAIDLG